MKLKFYLLFFLCVAYLPSCVSEFRPEIIDPRLPDYSEEGLNTAGAYVDGFPWNSRRRLSYFFIFPSGISRVGDINLYRSDSTSDNLLAFEFGKQTVDELEKRISIGFYLSNTQIDVPDDLLELKGKTIVLDGISNYGQLFLNPTNRTAESGPDTLHKGIGALHIRNVQITPKVDTLIISGTFGFDVQIDSTLHTVHSGRFDYTLSPNEIHNFRR